MKKNKKKYLKTNLIGFIIGGLLISGVAVYAAITFPSNEVSYDNSSSGLSSTNVQGAIDELYKTCTPAGEQIIKDNNLEKDPYECRYFFTGANPNNYATFNNETAGWRIISIGCDNTIKIMTDAIIDEHRAWDSSSIYGDNNWNRPARLNSYLNGDYYNSLTSNAQSQIVTANYSIGAVTYDNNDLADQINDENSTKWNGKVALVTASEYLRTNSNKSQCETNQLYNDNLSTCKNSTWMFNRGNWWLLSPESSNSSFVMDVGSKGTLGALAAYDTSDAVRPAITLSSEVQITGGDGSKSNPYTLG